MSDIMIPNTSVPVPARQELTITLTDAAKDEFRRLAAKGLYPRLVLSKAGCCGYRFLLYADKQKSADTLEHVDGFAIIIDPQVREFRDHLVIDYGRNGLFRDFTVKVR
ncbi:MAG: hypothetical protein IIZ34_00195 [Eubacterium sp.]|nr:hypothetical protein [Eubacterium sp.]